MTFERPTFERPTLLKRYTSPVLPTSQTHLDVPSRTFNPLPTPPVSPNPDLPSIHPLSSHRRVLRKVSQPDLSTTMPLQKSRNRQHAAHLSISPPSSASFLPFDNRSLNHSARHASSPPPSATTSAFSIDKSRTRKQSLAPSSPKWSEMMPSIQGVMGEVKPKTPKTAVFGFTRGGSIADRSPREDCSGGNEEASGVDFGGKKKTSRRSKRDTLQLPIMIPPLPTPPAVPRSLSSPNTGLGALRQAQAEQAERPNTAEAREYTQAGDYYTGYPVIDDLKGPRSTHTTHSKYGSPASRGVPYNSHDFSPVSHKKRSTDNSVSTDDGWDIVSLQPSPSSLAGQSLRSHHGPSSPTKPHHLEPSHPSTSQSHDHGGSEYEPGRYSDDINLRAVEVLEQLDNNHLSGGWGEALYNHHQQYTTSTVSLVTTGKKEKETGSMRSWRDGRKTRPKAFKRPVSAQTPLSPISPQPGPGLTREESATSVASGPPAVPPRHASRPAPVPKDRNTDAEKEKKHSSVGIAMSLRRKDKDRTGPVQSAFESEGDVMSPTSQLPIHMRPLPPVPDAPQKSSFSNKIQSRLRPKRPSTAPAPRPISPLSTANVASKKLSSSTSTSVSRTAETEPITSPRMYPRLLPREEPPAALGKRSSEVAERRKGMTAMAFLAMEDPNSRGASAKTSLASVSSVRSRAGGHTAGKESIDGSGVRGNDVVAHIIPPEELSKIVIEGKDDADDKGESSGDDVKESSDKFRLDPPSKESEDNWLSPPARSRQSGPVVPPRKMFLRAASLGPAESTSISPISPLPTARAKHSVSAAPDFGPVSSFSRKSPPSALTLPTNDRPSTMGGWDSPTFTPTSSRPESPGTPSPVKSTFDRKEYTGQYSSDDADFGRSSTRSSRVDQGIESDKAREDDDEDVEEADEGDPGLTPRSYRFDLGPSVNVGSVVSRKRSDDSDDLMAQTPRSQRVGTASGTAAWEFASTPFDDTEIKRGYGQEGSSPVSPKTPTAPATMRGLSSDANLRGTGAGHPFLDHLPDRSARPANPAQRADGVISPLDPSRRQGMISHPAVRTARAESNASDVSGVSGGSGRSGRSGRSAFEGKDAGADADADSMSVEERDILERAKAREALRMWLGSKPRRGEVTA